MGALVPVRVSLPSARKAILRANAATAEAGGPVVLQREEAVVVARGTTRTSHERPVQLLPTRTADFSSTAARAVGPAGQYRRDARPGEEAAGHGVSRCGFDLGGLGAGRVMVRDKIRRIGREMKENDRRGLVRENHTSDQAVPPTRYEKTQTTSAAITDGADL